jgi:hypothetical protein
LQSNAKRLMNEETEAAVALAKLKVTQFPPNVQFSGRPILADLDKASYESISRWTEL